MGIGDAVVKQPQPLPLTTVRSRTEALGLVTFRNHTFLIEVCPDVWSVRQAFSHLTSVILISVFAVQRLTVSYSFTVWHAFACTVTTLQTRVALSTVFPMIAQEEWTWEEGTARWKQLYSVLRGRIESGTYPPRRLIPSLMQMEEEFGLARNTIRKALARLSREGYVRPEQGVGTVVQLREKWRPETGEE